MPLLSNRAASREITYPTLAAAAAVAAGILTASVFNVGPREALASAAVLAIGGILWSVWHRRLTEANRVMLLSVGAMAMTVCAGCMRYSMYYAVQRNDLERIRLGETSVSGRIYEQPVHSEDSFRFRLRLAGYRSPVYLYVVGRSPGPLIPSRCDDVLVTGRVEPLPRRRNPAEFDYGAHLARGRVYARLNLADRGLVVTGRSRSGPICGLEGLREKMRSRLERHIRSARGRTVLEALILGDRRALDENIRDQFARMGLLHLLAVSGLHVMVVGMIFYRLLGPSLKRCGLSWRTANALRTVATATLLTGYMLVTGCSASVVRAVVMSLLYLASTTLQRPARPLDMLGGAIFVLLVARPSHLFEPGFQLSVAAIAAIIVGAPQLIAWVPPPRGVLARQVHGASVVTVAATLGTLPVLLFHFGQVGLAGILLNLPAIPITTAALTAGMATVLLGGQVDAVGDALGTSADLLSNALVQLAATGDRYLAWSVVGVRVDEPAVLIVMALLVTSVAYWRFSRIRWRCIIAALAACTMHVLLGSVYGRYRPHVEFIFLDVGQGDAAVALLPNARAVLIDAGPRSSFTDAGARVVVPQLAHLGITRLSAVVVSHPDADHLGGLPAVLRSVRVDRVLHPGFVHSSRLYDETNRLIDSLGVRRQTIHAGDTLEFGATVRAYVLHPPEGFDGSGANEHSIALIVQYGEVRFLLMGDVPAQAELDVVRRYGSQLGSHVLKVGHHGSRTSSTSAFLQRASLRGAHTTDDGGYAVISVAARNRYGLPDGAVLERLERVGFHPVLTSKEGAVWFRTNGRRLERVRWRRQVLGQ